MAPFGVVCIELRVMLKLIYVGELRLFRVSAISFAEVSVFLVFTKLGHCNCGWS